MQEIAKRDPLVNRSVRQECDQVGANSDPDLSFYGVQRVAKEVLDAQILLEPFEEQLNLPTLLINGRNRCRLKVKAIGQEDQIELRNGVVKAYPA